MDHPVDIDAAGALSFGLADELAPGEGAPHVHARHQLLYASAGTLTLHVSDSTWLLPPLRAAVLSAGTEHVVDVVGHASLRTTYLHPSLVPWAPPACAVFTVDALASAMLQAAPRFGPEDDSPAGRAFFAALAHLAEDWVARPLPLRLPRATTPDLARALRWTRAHLAEPIRVADAASVAGISPRTFARRMQTEALLPWQRYLQLARVLRAMELLADADVSVTEVALDVGYTSLPTFSRVFAAVAGSNPSTWRQTLR